METDKNEPQQELREESALLANSLFEHVPLKVTM